MRTRAGRRSTACSSRRGGMPVEGGARRPHEAKCQSCRRRQDLRDIPIALIGSQGLPAEHADSCKSPFPIYNICHPNCFAEVIRVPNPRKLRTVALFPFLHFLSPAPTELSFPFIKRGKKISFLFHRGGKDKCAEDRDVQTVQ